MIWRYPLSSILNQLDQLAPGSEMDNSISNGCDVYLCRNHNLLPILACATEIARQIAPVAAPIFVRRLRALSGPAPASYVMVLGLNV